MRAGEPELSVAPEVLKAPVHVYQANAGIGPLRLITEYGAETQTDQAPVLVLFYGQHYDALLDEGNRAPLRSDL